MSDSKSNGGDEWEVFGALAAAMESAKRKNEVLLTPLGEAITEESIEIKKHPLSTSIAELDKQLGGGLFPTELVLLQSGPGQGKTTLSLLMQVQGIAGANRPGLYVSTEMQPDELQARRACQVLNQRGTKCSWRDVLTGVVPIEVTREATANTNVHVYALRPTVDPVAAIRTQALWLAEKCGSAPFIVTDYLQGLSVGSATDDRRLTVGANAYALQALAVELKTPIVLVSSVNRAAYSSEEAREKTNPLDFLSASKEAGEIEFSCSVVLHLDVRADEDERGWRETRLLVCKSRFGQLGMVGMRFHGASGQFEHYAGACIDGLDRKLVELVAEKSISSMNQAAKALSKSKRDVAPAVRRLRARDVLRNGPTGAWSVGHWYQPEKEDSASDYND